jgi:hypothetical protein
METNRLVKPAPTSSSQSALRRALSTASFGSDAPKKQRSLCQVMLGLVSLIIIVQSGY